MDISRVRDRGLGVRKFSPPHGPLPTRRKEKGKGSVEDVNSQQSTDNHKTYTKSRELLSLFGRKRGITLHQGSGFIDKLRNMIKTRRIKRNSHTSKEVTELKEDDSDYDAQDYDESFQTPKENDDTQTTFREAEELDIEVNEDGHVTGQARPRQRPRIKSHRKHNRVKPDGESDSWSEKPDSWSEKPERDTEQDQDFVSETQQENMIHTHRETPNSDMADRIVDNIRNADGTTSEQPDHKGLSETEEVAEDVSGSEQESRPGEEVDNSDETSHTDAPAAETDVETDEETGEEEQSSWDASPARSSGSSHSSMATGLETDEDEAESDVRLPVDNATRARLSIKYLVRELSSDAEGM